MGKVRSKKSSRIARPDPTGLSKVENGEEEIEDLGLVSTFVQNILGQLQSHVAEERDSGLNSLSSAVSKQAYREEILKSDLIRVVRPLLLDPSVSVRHSAAGVLRNMSSISMGICKKIICADVMTGLVMLIKQHYSGDWVPISKEKKSKHPIKIDSATEALIEAINLLWNLCEASEVAVKVFNQERLGDTLMRFLNITTFGIRIGLCSALCLNSATEDNTDAVSNQSELEQLLVGILNLSDDSVDSWQLLYLQSTAVGILVNLRKGDLQQTSPELVNLMMSVINKSLEVDHLTQINKFSSDVPLHTSNGEHAEVYHRESESDLKKIFELDEKCESMMALVSSQIMSLEILSNIIITEDTDENLGDEDSDEEVMNDDADGMDDGEEDVEMRDITEVPEQVYECLSASGIVAKVLSKVKSLPVNVTQILQEDEAHGQNILRKCITLRSTALICLQNLVEVLSLADLEKCIGLGEFWAGLGSTLTELGPSDIIMVEAITSAMRAIVQSIVNQKSMHPAAAQLCQEFQVFNQVYETVNVVKVKVNVIKIIGCMGLLLSRFPKDSTTPVPTLLTQIAEYLLNCLSSTKLERQGLWLVAEVLDTIFDVFAEDDYNEVLKNVGLIPKLKLVQPVFKKQVRSERRSLGENAAVIQTANTNLPRFIQYKEKHKAV